MSKAFTPDAFTREHMLEWLRSSAPIDPDVEPEQYRDALSRFLDDGDRRGGRWLWAMHTGWRKTFDAARAEGYFDQIEAATAEED